MIKQILPNNSDLTFLPAFFSRYPGIQAVYLFGSAATHRTHFDSDLDLAVYPGTDSLKSQKMQLLADLAIKGFCQIDLHFLDGRDTVLDQFTGNSLLYGSAQRFLHLAIEAQIDIGNRLICDLDWERSIIMPTSRCG